CPNGSGGNGESMATKAVCVACERTVYLEENETGSCPVCSSPVIPALVDLSPPAFEGYYLG
ncbi:MAG TPA: hypothetical protein VHJ76_00880, partial [Actinomycetota bacterium]|nr:hypothetical protein [Actinomycetota bacterium]